MNVAVPVFPSGGVVPWRLGIRVELPNNVRSILFYILVLGLCTCGDRDGGLPICRR